MLAFSGREGGLTAGVEWAMHDRIEESLRVYMCRRLYADALARCSYISDLHIDLTKRCKYCCVIGTLSS